MISFLGSRTWDFRRVIFWGWFSFLLRFSAFLVVLFVPLALLFRRHPTRPSIYGADTALFKGDYFPDYQGGDNYDAACDYLLHRFVSLNQSAATKQIYAHYTCATDTQQIKCAYPFPISSLPLHRPSADADSPLQSSSAPSRTSSCNCTCASAGCYRQALPRAGCLRPRGTHQRVLYCPRLDRIFFSLLCIHSIFLYAIADSLLYVHVIARHPTTSTSAQHYYAQPQPLHFLTHNSVRSARAYVPFLSLDPSSLRCARPRDLGCGRAWYLAGFERTRLGLFSRIS